MMNKIKIYKLALLGCASVCSMNVAHAFSHGSIELIGPEEFRDVACGAEERFAHFTLKNRSHRDVWVTSTKMIINEDDDFKDNPFLAQALPAAHNHHYCGYGVPAGSPFLLPKHRSCHFTIEVNPEGMDCSPPAQANTDQPLIPVGEIDRTFKISFSSKPSISIPIDYDMTYLGSTKSFALVGKDIRSGVTDEDPSAEAGVIQLYQDVAITKYGGYLTDDIAYHDHSRAFRVDHYFGHDIAKAAGYDVYAAYHNLFNLQAPSFHGCEPLPEEDVIDNGGMNKVYCADQLTIDSTLTFKGEGQTIIIINHTDVPEATSDAPPAILHINKGADFDVCQDSATPIRNIFWVVNGSIEMQSDTRAVGNFLMNGTYKVPNQSGNQGQVVGRLLTLGNLELQGNSIVDPHLYECP